MAKRFALVLALIICEHSISYAEEAQAATGVYPQEISSPESYAQEVYNQQMMGGAVDENGQAIVPVETEPAVMQDPTREAAAAEAPAATTEAAPVQPSMEETIKGEGKKLMCQTEEITCASSCDSSRMLLASYCNYFNDDEKQKCINNADFSTGYCKAGCTWVSRECAGIKE